MKKYYLHDGSASRGPFSADEIKQSGIDPGTLVWAEGMDKWAQAKDIPELTNLLIIPPPLSAGEGDRAGQDPDIPISSKAALLHSSNHFFILTILIALVSVIILFIRLSQPSGKTEAVAGMEASVISDTAIVLPQSAIEPPQISPEEKARNAEQDNPGKYLSISTAIEKNLLLQPVIKGTVYNKASATTYKDIELRFGYMGKDGVFIGEEYITIEGTVGPGELAEIHHKPAKKAYRKAAGYTVTVYNVQLLSKGAK